MNNAKRYTFSSLQIIEIQKIGCPIIPIDVIDRDEHDNFILLTAIPTFVTSVIYSGIIVEGENRFI